MNVPFIVHNCPTYFAFKVYTADERYKTFSYVLDVPTAAPNIALAVGYVALYFELFKSR